MWGMGGDHEYLRGKFYENISDQTCAYRYTVKTHSGLSSFCLWNLQWAIVTYM